MEYLIVAISVSGWIVAGMALVQTRRVGIALTAVSGILRALAVQQDTIMEDHKRIGDQCGEVAKLLVELAHEKYDRDTQG